MAESEKHRKARLERLYKASKGETLPDLKSISMECDSMVEIWVFLHEQDNELANFLKDKLSLAMCFTGIELPEELEAYSFDYWKPTLINQGLITVDDGSATH